MPRIRCVVCGVSNRLTTVFRFPTHAAMIERWKKIVGVKFVGPTSGLCLNHFKAEDINLNKKRVLLRPGAVPSQKLGDHSAEVVDQTQPSTSSSALMEMEDHPRVATSPCREKRQKVLKSIRVRAVTHARLKKVREKLHCRTVGEAVAILAERCLWGEEASAKKVVNASTPIRLSTEADVIQQSIATPSSVATFEPLENAVPYTPLTRYSFSPDSPITPRQDLAEAEMLETMYQGVTPVVDALDETVRHVTRSTPASRQRDSGKRSRRCSWTLRSSRFHVQSLRIAGHRRRLRLPVNVLRKLHKVAESHGTKDLVTAVGVLCDCPAAAAPPDAATIGARASRAGRLAMKQIIHTDKAPAAIGPYSQAVLVERTLYISGQLGMDATTGQLSDGVEAQTRLAMENMGHILEAAGMTHSNVVKATVLLADMNDFTKVNDVYKTFFTAEFPARAAYQVAALPKDGRVEIEAVAVKTT